MKQLYRMIRWTLVLLLALAGMRTQAQAPGWADAMQMVAPGAAGSYSQINASTTDANGNIVLAGEYTGTVQFGSMVHTATERYNIFVAKWNIVTREFDWVVEAPTNTSCHEIGLVRNGNSYYLLGMILNAHLFSYIGFGSNELTATHGSWQYVARVTDTGNAPQFDWAMLLPLDNSPSDYGLCVSGGHTYLTGEFPPYGMQLDKLTLEPVGRYATRFIARLNDPGMAGGVTWARTLGSADTSRGAEMGIAGNGPNLYLTGTFRGTVNLGGVVLRSAAPSCTYIARLVDDGTTARVVWAKALGGTNQENYAALAVQDSTVYLAGNVGPAATAFDNLILPASDSSRNFVARLSASGTCEWVQATSGPGRATILQVLAHGSQVYLAGVSNYFGPGAIQFGATTLQGNPTDFQPGDAVVARLTDNGTYATFDWAQMVGGPDYEMAFGLTWAGNDLYVVGLFNASRIDFGTTQLVGTAIGLNTFVVRVPNAGASVNLASRPAAALPLYPNPAHGAATVPLPAHAVQGSPVTLTLLDALGRPVRTQTVALTTYATTHALDLTGVAPGLYLLRLLTDGRATTQRLVVE